MPRKTILLSQTCEVMIRYKQASDKSENTIADYRVTFTKVLVLGYFESDPPIGDISKNEMVEFFAWFQEDYAAEPGGVACSQRKIQALCKDGVEYTYQPVCAMALGS